MPAALKKSGFFDLKEDWYREAVDWAAQTGVVKGTGNNAFFPLRAFDARADLHDDVSLCKIQRRDDSR